jgi:hypothetical protein
MANQGGDRYFSVKVSYSKVYGVNLLQMAELRAAIEGPSIRVGLSLPLSQRDIQKQSFSD